MYKDFDMQAKPDSWTVDPIGTPGCYCKVLAASAPNASSGRTSGKCPAMSIV